MSLKLNKVSKGRYSNRSGNILITVEKEFSTNYWVGRIELYSHVSQDFSGNDVEMFNDLYLSLIHI